MISTRLLRGSAPLAGCRGLAAPAELVWIKSADTPFICRNAVTASARTLLTEALPAAASAASA
jgi:hypothetical protein